MKLVLALLLNLAAISILHGQWSHDPAVNTALDKPGDQRAPLVATDGKGGAIVAWAEERSVFANRIDKFGFRQWGADGVRISPGDRYAFVTNITSDGQGGAVILWEDLTHAREVGTEVVRIIENEMFAQRVDSLGQLVWNAGGIGVRTKLDSTTVSGFGLVTSGLGEFIAFWIDDRAHPFPEIVPLDFYAQKLTADGEIEWTPNGQLISLQGATFNPSYRISTDGAAGFFLARFDNDQNAQQAVVVDRISDAGELLWPVGGVPVHTGGAFEMVSDGQGGAIVAGVFFPGGGFVGQIKVQRVGSSGQLLWGDSARVVMIDVDLRSSPRIVSDADGGAIVYWGAKSDAGREGFFQHVDSSGHLLGERSTTRFGLTSNTQPIVLSDGDGGMLFMANDFEGGMWGLRADSGGKLLWEPRGVLFRKRPFNDWPFFFDAVADGTGGFIAIWDEFISNKTFTDVVVQQLSTRGILGEVITSVRQAPQLSQPEQYELLQNYPNPFNPQTQISFTLRRRGAVSLIVYDLSGKEVRTLIDEDLAAGNHRATWDGRDGSGALVASGIYFYRLGVNNFKAVRKMLYLH